MSNYGIKISRPTKSVWSSSEKDFVFNSKYSLMGTYMVGTATYTFSSDIGSVTVEITHDLGYRPAVWLSINGPGASTRKTTDWWVEYYNSGSDKALRSWIKYVTTTKLQIKYDETNVEGAGYNPNGETWNFKYYIFAEGNL